MGIRNPYAIGTNENNINKIPIGFNSTRLLFQLFVKIVIIIPITSITNPNPTIFHLIGFFNTSALDLRELKNHSDFQT